MFDELLKIITIYNESTYSFCSRLHLYHIPKTKNTQFLVM